MLGARRDEGADLSLVLVGRRAEETQEFGAMGRDRLAGGRSGEGVDPMEQTARKRRRGFDRIREREEKSLLRASTSDARRRGEQRGEQRGPGR